MDIRKKPSKRGLYRKYDVEDLKDAYKSVIEDGIPVERAAKRFCVPITTLKDRVKGRVDITTVKSGPATVFTSEQERLLSDHLKTMAEVGYGYSRQETLNLASDYACHLGVRDKEHPLGHYWFYGFLSRRPDLKLTKHRSLEVARAKSATESAISNYFSELKTVLDKYDISDKPNMIYNVDEKGLNSEHKPPRIVSSKHYKAQAVTSGKGKNVTLIGCGNAEGQQIPPFFVFPGKRMSDSLMEGASPGAFGVVSDTGWSNSTIFEQYMKEHLVKYLPNRKPDEYVLVLHDGHRSHVTIPLIEWAIEQHIVLFVLPPHCSHILQPLDISCFGPLELAWNSACHRYLRESGGKVITRYDVCRIACKVYTSTLTANNIQVAFRKSGIFPFDQSVISPITTAPSTAFPKPAVLQTDKSAESFLESKGGEILKNVSVSKPRNTLSKVVSGKAITEPTVHAAVIEHVASQNPPTSKSKTCSKSKLKGKHKAQVPGPSGLKRKTPPNTYPGNLSDTSIESDIEESDKCIICGKFSPDGLKETPFLTIVKWACCDLCDNWVHIFLYTSKSIKTR